MDDLLEGIAFTIRTYHRNLLYMNKNGSKKVLQWELDIQHYNAIIFHVPGTLNIPVVSKVPIVYGFEKLWSPSRI